MTAGIGLKVTTDEGTVKADFDNWDFDGYAIDGEGVTFQNNGVVTASPRAFMSPDQFYQNFKGVFQIGGHMTGLQTLPIQTHEAEGARATSDLIYEQACKVTWLQWLVAEEGSDAARYLSVAMFGLGKAMAVRAELSARYAAQVEVQKAKEAEAKTDDA